MQQRQKVDGLGVIIDEIKNRKVLMQCRDTHLVRLCGWLHRRERRNV